MPKTDCKKCGGDGYTYNEESDSYDECLCLLKIRAVEYLTYKYSNYAWDNSFDPSPWLKSVLFHGNVELFNAMVKSVLLNTGMQYSHMTTSPWGIMERYLTPIETSGGREYRELKDVDILIIKFISDPSNREYSNVIGHILDERHDIEKWTWIQTQRDPSSQEWYNLYGEKLCGMVSDKKRFAHVSNGGLVLANVDSDFKEKEKGNFTVYGFET